MADLTYTKTTWVDGQTPVNAANMNNIETGLSNAITAFNNMSSFYLRKFTKLIFSI